MRIKQGFFGAVAASGLALGAGVANAQDGRGGGPLVKVEHPPAVEQQGGQRVREVDCGTLLNMQGQLWLTCEFAEQVDSNGQEICNVTDNLPSDEAGKKNAASIALYQALTHFGRVHGDCVSQAGSVDTRLSKDASKIYGDGWESKNACTLVEARNQCKSALGLD